MDDDFLKSIMDYYAPHEIVELLDIEDSTYLNLLQFLEEELNDNIEQIKEDMNYDPCN